MMEKDWVPFYRDCRYPDVESYSELLWNNIMTLKNEVQKSLCRGGQWDGRTTSARVVGAPSFFFRYLKDELDCAFGHEMSTKTIRCIRSRKVMHDNFAVSRRRLKLEGDFIQIFNEDELDAVRKVFGNSFGVGVMKAAPSVKKLRANSALKSTVYLTNDDPVRIVSCSPDGTDINRGMGKSLFCTSQGVKVDRPMSLNCSHRGMDFRFTAAKYAGLTQISVQSRFIKVKGRAVVVTRLLGRGVSDGAISDSEGSHGMVGNSESIVVSTGDYLTLDGPRFVVVTDVTDDGRVRCISPNNSDTESVYIAMNEAKEGLLRQLS
jgi:hypothetical protein